MYVKRFLEWIGLKEKLDLKDCDPPYVNEGDIWWISVGENVGSEINGKSNLFSRPAIILKKLAHGFYFVIPTTTKDQNGSWFVKFNHKGRAMNACLHQARSVDHRRFYSKLGRLDDEDFEKIKKGFLELYG
ncbi:hypothetical protein COU74_02545 [Candidatus Peregrinibacteria bacterium CG10_big_fil_rev_8_21_14_0_10_36_19]|nr:MAG: hypothetical protein COU74_02545 [Candidatus Peregrinibacteria bacterium CG10_big_fil_rev_8_21_14_0_10_36_19]